MAEQPLSARRRVVTLTAMCIAQGMMPLDNTIVNVARPSIQPELDVDQGNLIWAVNAPMCSPSHRSSWGVGPWDRYGRKRVFLVGLASFTAMSAACALSTTSRCSSPRAQSVGGPATC